MRSVNRAVAINRFQHNRRHPEVIFGAGPDTSYPVGPTRQAALAREEATVMSRAGQLNVLFAKYDTDHSGALDKEQLKTLMLDFSKTLGFNDTSVSDADVEDLLKMCDRSETGDLNRHEVILGIKLWRRHLSVLSDIAPQFAKYDKDDSGRLERKELKKLLTELNDGIEVSEGEVNMVLQNADKLGNGKIGRMEMEKALSCWYTHMREERANSACCTIQ